MAEKQKNVHVGHRARLRKRALEHGIDSLAEHEILELLLSFTIARKDTNPLGHQLLDKYGSISNVLNAGYHELLKEKGIGETTASMLALLPQVLGYYAYDYWAEKNIYLSAADLKPLVVNMFITHTVESFYMLCMNAKNQIISTVCLGRGTVDGVAVYPSMVAEKAIQNKSRCVVLLHNHPGGVAKPSGSDITLTEQCLKSLAAVDVHVLDHIIAAGPLCYSMKENNILDVLKGKYGLKILDF